MLAAVLERVKHDYVNPVDDHQLLQAAIRGMVASLDPYSAYLDGDLKLALADFNRAIALNPTFMIAYINRGIVLYRIGELDRALADVARARQIDRAGRSGSAAAFHRRRRRDASLIESLALAAGCEIVARRLG